VKSQSPPLGSEEKSYKPLPYNRQSSAVNEGVLDMLESLGDLSLSMSVPTSSHSPPPTPSPETVPEEEKFAETTLRTKKETGGCTRPMSVPAFSVFRRKTSDCLTERPKSPEKRPNSLQPRPSTPTSGLIRPEPRKPASVFSELQPRSRLSADYTALDQHLATFKPIETPSLAKITNQKSKFEPKNEVPVWTVEDVASWVATSGFQDFAPAFQELRVDGDMLLQLTETEIRDDIGISNGILRKRFMRELKELKKSADYTSCDGGLMANFLNRISTEFKVYTYNLILKELSLDFMQRLTTTDMDDMLKDSGVESAIHRHKIIEAVLNIDEESSFSDSVYSEPSIDVYLSYSQSRAELASLIKIQLEQRDPDLSIIDACHDDKETFSEDVSFLIKDSKYFVLILSPGGLDSCLSSRSGLCRLYQEIRTALKAGLKIIPVTDEFQWPLPEMLPEEIRKVASYNGVRWVHDYQEACLGKLERFIKGEHLRVESPYCLKKSGRDSGRSTPNISSPLIIQKFLKNRAVSIESNPGSQST